MKKFIIISILSLVGIGLFFAGVKDRTRPLQSASVFGDASDQSYLVCGGGAGDTIVVSDTVRVPVVVNHSAIVQPYIQLYYDKISSGTATIAATYWQSNDGVNYKQLLKGKNQSAYAKSLALAADTTIWTSFAADTVVFEGRFLMMKYITSSTASVKGKLTHRIKFNL